MENAKTVKLSKKGQIVIPRDAREKLGLREGSRLVVSVRDDEIVLESPERYAGKTRGSLKGRWGKTKEEVAEYLAGERESWR
ncbi:MAG: AbrB/MazE/SpoVT family DNA-binding domain-containing protein [Candidatus Aquicultorales bacterium]